MPALAVVLSTYNQPDWLRLALVGYACQRATDFEVWVADDGSGPATAAVIDSLRPTLPYRLHHVWHPDQGFRKCAILNAALRQVDADYVLFSDGDCIPRADFLATHLALRAPGRFLSGGYVKLPRPVSMRISEEDVRSGRCFRLDWLRGQHARLGRNALKLQSSAWLAGALDRLSPARASWNGHNASGWLADIVTANGFDERMQYGGEDRELGERLENAGVRGLRIRFRAPCLHLDHERSYVAPGMRATNDAIRRHTRSQRICRTPFGLRHESEAEHAGREALPAFRATSG